MWPGEVKPTAPQSDNLLAPRTPISHLSTDRSGRYVKRNTGRGRIRIFTQSGDLSGRPIQLPSGLLSAIVGGQARKASMKIAIIGTGQVAAALGKGWAARGHMVTFASRDPGTERVQALVGEAGPNASAARVADAVARSSVIVLAVPFTAARERLEMAGDVGGKVVI